MLTSCQVGRFQFGFRSSAAGWYVTMSGRPCSRFTATAAERASGEPAGIASIKRWDPMVAVSISLWRIAGMHSATVTL